MNEQPHNGPRYTGLRDYLRVVRERWLLITAVALGIGAAAFAYAASKPKEYEAQTLLSARQEADDVALLGTVSGSPASPQALTTQLATLATRESIANATRKALHTDLTTGSIRSKVSVRIDVQTNLVVISASDGSPGFAARLSNEYADQVNYEATRDQRKQVTDALRLVTAQRDEARRGRPSDFSSVLLEERFNRLQTLQKILRPVDIVVRATPPAVAASPRPKRDTALGLIGGLFLGLILAFSRESLDTRLKSPRDMESYFGLTRLGQLSDDAFGRVVHSTGGARELDAADLEAVRMIRSSLDLLGGEAGLRSTAITSPLPGDGKTTVAIALASVSALSGRLTLLIEGDLHQPVLAQRLGLDAEPGLSDVLLGKAQPREALQVVDIGMEADGDADDHAKLVCLTAGSPTRNPADLLTPERLGSVLSKVSKIYDSIVVDTAPLLAVADTREILQLVDSTIVCARSYHTTKEQAQAAREVLGQIPPQPSGLVVTGVKARDDAYRSYYYGYAQS